jgi:ankyrin repeat protein
VKWLLDRGVDPNARWAHWNAEVTPPHLAAAHGHTSVARLLESGADPAICDSEHDSDARWAEFFQQPEIVRILTDHSEGIATSIRPDAGSRRVREQPPDVVIRQAV